MRPLIGNSKFIFTIPEPRPAYAAPVMAIKSYLISIFATQGLILCFCTECSLHWEQLPSLLLGQREFAFTLTRWRWSEVAVVSGSATPWTVAHQAPQNSPGKSTRLGCHFLLHVLTRKLCILLHDGKCLLKSFKSSQSPVYCSLCLWDLSSSYYKTVKLTENIHQE